MGKHESVVLITSRLPDNKSFGTGFAVYKQGNTCFIVTCAHVVRDVGGKDAVLVNKQEAELITTVEPITIDLAVLKVDGLEISSLSIGKGNEGAKVEILGYSKLHGDTSLLKDLEGTLEKEAKLFSGQRIDTWELEITDKSLLTSGYSGSPVIDVNTGLVVGVASYAQYDGRTGYAVSVAELKEVWQEIPPNLIRENPVLNDTDDRLPKISFTNREEELNMLSYSERSNLTLYFVVDAPAGYGKSTLLKEVEKRYKAKKWAYALVQVQNSSELRELAFKLCENLEIDGKKLNINKTNGDSLGEQVGGGIVNKFRKKLPEGNGLVIIIDLEGELNQKLADEVFLEFIPDLTRVFNRLKAREAQRSLKLYIMVAGRYLKQNAEEYEKKLTLTYVPLSPFKFKHIYGSAQNYFNGIADSEAKLIAGLALCLGAGHPGCMSYIFHDNGKCGLPANDYLERHGQDILESVVFNYAQDVCRQMDSVIQNPDIYYLLSMFRYVDDRVLDQIVRKYAKDEFRHGIELGDKLTGTCLFQRKSDLIEDSIVRRLISLNLYHTDQKKFKDFCREAQRICKDNISSSLTDPNLWVIEYLFQCLQEQLGQSCLTLIGTEGTQANLYQQFMKEKVPEIIKELKKVYDKLPEYDQRSKKNSLLRRLKHEDQWEFNFAVNYHLRQDKYTERPFEDLLSKIKTLL